MSLEDDTRVYCCDRGQKEYRRRVRTERGLQPPSPLGPSLLIVASQVQFFGVDNIDACIWNAPTPTVQHNSSHRDTDRAGAVMYYTLRVLGATTDASIRSARRARGSLWTSKNVLEAQYDDSELAHTQLQPTGSQYQGCLMGRQAQANTKYIHGGKGSRDLGIHGLATHHSAVTCLF